MPVRPELITAASPAAIVPFALDELAKGEEWCAVVPRAHLAREIATQLLDRLGMGAWIGQRVMTSAALLEHFGRGLQAQPVLTSLQQRQVIAAIAEAAHEEDALVLDGRVVEGRVAEATLRSLVHLFGEIEPRRVSAEDLEQELVEGAATGSLSRRGRDLVLLWRQYADRLDAEGFLGPRGFELLSADAASKLPIPERPSRFVFLGLDGYGPWDPEVRLAYSLARNPAVEEVKIALVVPESPTATSWALHGNEPIYMDYTERFGKRFVFSGAPKGNALDLQAIGEDPFAYRDHPAEATGAVQRVRLPDADLEVEWVVRTIKDQILHGAAAPSDIAIIDRRMDDRAEDFERVLAAAGIPAVASFEQQVAQVPAVRAILTVYRLIADGWRTGDLVTVAESPYLPFDLSPTLLNRVGSAGVEPRSPTEWTERVNLLAEDSTDALAGPGMPADVAEQAESLPRRFAEFCKELTRLFGEGLNTPSEWVSGLVQLTRDWNVEEAVYRPATGVDRAERARVVRRDLDGLNAFLKGAHDWLRGWEIAGREPDAALPARRWYGELQAIAREGQIRASSYPRDAVQLLTPSQAALRTWPTVFVTGVVDGEFPARLRPDEVTLTEEERRALSLPATEEREARERLLFHLAAATAIDKLTVSTYAADSRGRAAVSSAFFEGLSLRIDGLVTADLEAKTLIPTDAHETAFPADRLVLAAGDYRRTLTDPGRPSDTIESSALRAWLNDPRAGRTIRAWQAERARWASMIGTSAAPEPWRSFAGLLDPRDDEVAVTPSELEAYGNCGFKYLAGSTWRLDPELDGDEAAAYGSLHHDILERLYEDLKRDGAFPPTSPDQIDAALARLNEIADEEVRAFSNTTQERLYALDLDFVVDVLRSFVRRDLLLAYSTETSDGIPFPRTRVLDVEVAVGRRGRPIRTTVGDMTFGLFGRIDRLETIQDDRLPSDLQQALLIRDYKSSPREYLPRPMGYFEGRDLQLPLYAYLAEQVFGRPVFGFQEVRIAQDGDREPVWRHGLVEVEGGVATVPWTFKYYGEPQRFDDPIEAAQQAALAKSSDHVRSIEAGRFDTPPDRNCWGCRLGRVCRAAKSSYNMARERPRPRMPIAVSWNQFSANEGPS